MLEVLVIDTELRAHRPECSRGQLFLEILDGGTTLISDVECSVAAFTQSWDPAEFEVSAISVALDAAEELAAPHDLSIVQMCTSVNGRLWEIHRFGVDS
jgi:hypothetical protein